MNSTNTINIKTSAFIKVSLFVCIVLLLMTCQTDNDDTPTPQDAINGFWEIADKGWIFEFKDGNDIFYNTNAAGCSVQSDDFVLQDFFGFRFDLISENELIASSELSDSEIKFVRLANQDSDCLPDQISSSNDPQVNFDHFWNIFNDYYAFFEARNIDWSQYENLRNQVTTENFYDTLEELAYLLEDGHVSIIDENKDVEIESGNPKLFERMNANLSGEVVIENRDDYNALFNRKAITIVSKYLGGDFKIDQREKIIWGSINDNVGYILVSSMEGFGTDFDNELSALNAVLDTVMNDLKDAGVTKLIIDMRFNDGGYDTAALNMVSRFMDQDRMLYSKKARLGDSFTENKSFNVGPRGDFQFTEDIVVLSSSYTISAAELFMLCLKDLPYVTIVGENTNGAFSTILTHVLPNGAEIGLSNEIYSDAQGAIFEIVGIGPKNEENRIPFLSTSDFEQEKDSGIDRALEVLDN